jgi:LPXTG-motif cell wall-anchored protein
VGIGRVRDSVNVWEMESSMKRIAVVGALMFVLMILAVPAFAQVGGGSVLPPQSQTQTLPARVVSSTDTRAPALADTGLSVTNGALLGVGLLAVGGVALVASRRRRNAE